MNRSRVIVVFKPISLPSSAVGTTIGVQQHPAVVGSKLKNFFEEDAVPLVAGITRAVGKVFEGAQ